MIYHSLINGNFINIEWVRIDSRPHSANGYTPSQILHLIIIVELSVKVTGNQMSFMMILMEFIKNH